MLKPLYLCPSASVAVRLDGPALAVFGEQAPQSFPLSRLSRIIVSGAVEFETQALLECAEHGVPVTFLAPDGTPRAHFDGRRSRGNDLRQLLLDLVDRPDWFERYADWRAAVERRAILAALRGSCVALDDLRFPAIVRSRLDRLAESLAGMRAAVDVARRFEGLLEAHVVSVLDQRALIAATAPATPIGPDLARDLVRVVRWYLEPLRIGWLRRRNRWERHGGSADAPTPTEVVRLYERRSRRTQNIIERQLSSLHVWLADLFS
jgi:hypothetical protein